MDLRKQFGVECDFGKILGALRHFGKAAVEVCQKRHEIESEMLRGVGFEVAVDAAVKFSRPTDIAVAEMVERDGRLDQPLVELPRGAPVFRPEFLPDLVAFVIIALVELLDPVKIERYQPRPGECGRRP